MVDVSEVPWALLPGPKVLVLRWFAAPRWGALPAPPIIPRLPAPPVPLMLAWVRPVEEAATLPLVAVRSFTSIVAEPRTSPVAPEPLRKARVEPERFAEMRPDDPAEPRREPVAEPVAPPQVLVQDGSGSVERASTARWDDPFAGTREDAEAVARPRTPEPDPWSIMPSRTLRGAGLRRLSRHVDEPQVVETLKEKAEKGPVETAPVAAPVSLWDILILPSQDGFRTSEQGVKALILYLDRAQLLRSPTVLSLEEFVGHPQHGQGETWRQRMSGIEDDTRLISLAAGVFAHQIFYEGAAPVGDGAVKTAHIGTRSKPAGLPFGPADRQAAFWLALVGCRFDTPSRGFLERIHSILYLRPVVHVTPHQPRS